ncbi:hypothetical protein D3C87_1759160 [compost metagenome]
MNLDKRNIFLLDGVGALVSATFTGIVLPFFAQWIGLPLWFLYCLAVLPLTYGIYSLSCYWLIKAIRPFMLKAIIIANLFYCFISGVVIFVYPGLTVWGRLLLTGEILIVLGVVLIELKVYRNAFSQIC